MTITVEKAVEIAKPFVGSLRGKFAARAVLKSALIKGEYLTATDAHRLIRLQLDKERAPYLHHYKEISEGQTSSNYPATDRLIPSASDAKQSFLIDLNKWIEAHKEALEHAKGLKNKDVHLDSNGTLFTPAPGCEADRFTCRLSDKPINIEKTAYNCQYMLDALKALKKLKHKEVTLHWYSTVRPMLLKAEGVEIVLLPVRVY
jgi:DNA polymerase III sliding clamp (beta) subunit (PCNA family)